MLQAVLSWLGNNQYQADVVSDAPGTPEAFVLVQVYNTVYNLGKVTVGTAAVMEMPATVPYGPMLVGAVTLDGDVTPRWSYCIHEGNPDTTVNFMAQLRRRALTTHPMPNRITGYRLRVDVVATRGLSPTTGDAIFLFRKNRDDRREDELSDELLCVCKPGDLEEYPKDTPEEDGVFFRKSYVDIVDADPNRMEQVWQDLKRDVDRLMFTLECNARLNHEELVLCNGRQ